MRFLVCLLVSFSLSAAQGGGTIVVKPDHQGDGGERWRQAVTVPHSFGELDADADGKVSRRERDEIRAQLERAIKETRAAIVEALDDDDSGKLSAYEAAEGKPRLRSLYDCARAIGISAHDADGDGVLSAEEAKPITGRLRNLFQQAGVRADTDGNRQISRDEAGEAVLAVIHGKRSAMSLCDRNNDGQLAQMELDILFNILRSIAAE